VTSSLDSNPGIGGSEFHAVQLALTLAELGLNVTVICEGEAPVFREDQNLVFVEGSNLNSTDFDIVITSVGSVSRLANLGLTTISAILISHHPHDGNLLQDWSSLANPRVLVNVGRYQLMSNRHSGIKSVWLPTFTPPPKTVSQNLINTGSGKLKVGHLSSLHPSKGFHVALKGWVKYAQASLPNSTSLSVIGSSQLYDSSMTRDQNRIPIDGPYGRKLESILAQARDSTQLEVQYLGLVEGGVDTEVQSWDVAVQNPIGLAEADPMVVQDCLRSGVPVIGSSLFGMYDYTRFFPELRAHTAWGVSRKLKLFQKSTEKRREMQERARHVYGGLYERRQTTSSEWVKLLDEVACNMEIRAGLPIGKIELGLVISLTIGTAVNWAAVNAEKIKNWISRKTSYRA
jgi:hypothetical protein